jgi:hypothetical protein
MGATVLSIMFGGPMAMTAVAAAAIAAAVAAAGINIRALAAATATGLRAAGILIVRVAAALTRRLRAWARGARTCLALARVLMRQRSMLARWCRWLRALLGRSALGRALLSARAGRLAKKGQQSAAASTMTLGSESIRRRWRIGMWGLHTWRPRLGWARMRSAASSPPSPPPVPAEGLDKGLWEVLNAKLFTYQTVQH